MFGRFLVYGFLGWAAEVVFTGTSAAVHQRDPAGTAKTYLWMHPIYGAAGLFLEWLGRKLNRVPAAARPFAYLPVIYGVEYATGWALRRALGRCPWDYERRGWNVHGLVRLDYAPAWLLAGYLFEPVAERVHRATAPIAHAASAAAHELSRSPRA